MRLVGGEDGFALLIAAGRAGVDAPRGLVVAVDGELDRPGRAAFHFRSFYKFSR